MDETALLKRSVTFSPPALFKILGGLFNRWAFCLIQPWSLLCAFHLVVRSDPRIFYCSNYSRLPWVGIKPKRRRGICYWNNWRAQKRGPRHFTDVPVHCVKCVATPISRIWDGTQSGRRSYNCESLNVSTPDDESCCQRCHECSSRNGN